MMIYPRGKKIKKERADEPAIDEVFYVIKGDDDQIAFEVGIQDMMVSGEEQGRNINVNKNKHI